MISKEIVIQCKNGDRKAQKVLFKAFAEKMFMHCYRYVKQREDAEEVLSEGFVKVFANLSKLEYRDSKSFEGWIKRIMVNESLMFLRKQKVRFSEQEDAQVPEKSQSVEGDMAAEDIYKLILELPVGYRTIFNLFIIEGYSHKEIAEKLRIAESTSRSQLTKARKMLQQAISKAQT